MEEKKTQQNKKRERGENEEPKEIVVSPSSTNPYPLQRCEEDPTESKMAKSRKRGNGRGKRPINCKGESKSITWVLSGGKEKNQPGGRMIEERRAKEHSATGIQNGILKAIKE